MDLMEGYWLKDTEFIGGNEMTIGDLSAACELYQSQLGHIDLSRWPKTEKWVKRMVFDVPEMKKTHQVVFGMIEKIKK